MTHQLNMHGMNEPDAQATPEQRQAAQRTPNAATLGLTGSMVMPGPLGSPAWSDAANSLADPTRAWSEPDPR